MDCIAAELSREQEASETTWGAIRQGLGIPEGFKGAIRCTQEERARLIGVVFTHMVFGWGTTDDLFILPDHARQILHTDHHDVIHVSFAEGAAISPFVAAMKGQGYELPTELPDETFKRPGWLPESPVVSEE